MTLPVTAPVAMARRSVRAQGRAGRPLHPDVPWCVREAGVLALVVVVGAVVLLAGWFGAARSTDFDAQAGWAALAVVGAAVSAAGQVFWLRRGLRRVRRLRREVLRDLPRVLPALAVTRAGAGGTTESVRPSAVVLVQVPGGTVFHRRECPVARNKPGTAMSRPEHEAAGRRPCAVCLGGGTR